MVRCEFCKYLTPEGECYWEAHSSRVGYCEKAVKRMMECFKGDINKIKRFLNKERKEV